MAEATEAGRENCTEQPSRAALPGAPPPGTPLTAAEKLTLLRWHLDRYDRLRASTATRAAVVLSASTLLSAANAVIISQLLGSAGGSVAIAALIACMIIVLISSSLVVLAVLSASEVLVTIRSSRAMLDGANAPPVGLVFNGTDTVAHLTSYRQFVETVATQRDTDILTAAQVELWIGIHQHRQRYLNLRRSVRLLRYASFALLVSLVALITTNLVSRL